MRKRETKTSMKAQLGEMEYGWCKERGMRLPTNLLGCDNSFQFPSHKIESPPTLEKNKNEKDSAYHRSKHPLKARKRKNRPEEQGERGTRNKPVILLPFYLDWTGLSRTELDGIGRGLEEDISRRKEGRKEGR